MASPAQLVELVSAVTGVPPRTISDIDRKLAIAKLRTKTGRGFSVAQMSPLDAARLLTGLLASAQSKDAAEAVLRYARTQTDLARSSAGLFGAAGLKDLAELPPGHGFVDALAAVVASASSGDLAKIIASGSPPKIEVFAFVRATRGRIRIAGLPNGLTEIGRAHV